MTDALFEIVGQPQLSWSVFEARIRERMSKLSRATLLLHAPLVGAGDLEAFVRKGAKLTLRGENADGTVVSRRFYGEVTKAERRVVDASFPGTFELVVKPSMVRLKRRRTSRVFQNLSVVEIVQSICEEHGVAVRTRLRKSYEKREYTIQYRETDDAFVRRLLAAVGVFFFFDHPTVAGDLDHTGIGDREVLVLADYADAYAPLSPEPNLTFRPRMMGSALQDDLFQVSAFHPSRSSQFRRAVTKRHDYKVPAARLVSDASSADDAPKRGMGSEGISPSDVHIVPPGNHYDHYHDDQEREAVDAAAHRTVAQLQRGASRATGESKCQVLAPGSRFFLRDHPEVEDRWWAVTGVDHHFGRGQRGSAIAANPVQSTDAYAYSNHFRAVPAEVAFCPKLRAPKRHHIVETAVVTGPGTGDIHTDHLGRVQVRFHWELDPEKSPSSCWVRVSQTWAGAGWGFQFIPRVGMEVLVAFVGGDLDSPLVVGSVPNGMERPPFPLPAGSRAGIRTRSTPGGGGHNELSFEDQSGLEEVRLRAEREFRQTVGEDAFVDIGRHCTATVGGSEKRSVSESSSLSIGGDQEVSIVGSQSTKSDADVVLEAESHRRHLRKHEHAVIEGMTFTQRRGVVRQQHHSTVTADYQDDLLVRTWGNEVHVVGRVGQERSYSVHAEGELKQHASKTVTVSADSRLELACGESRIVLTPSGVAIDAPTITLTSGDVRFQVDADAATAVAGGSVATFAAGGIALKAEGGAGIELNSDAKVDGAQVLLNSPVLGQADVITKPIEDTTISLADEHGDPIPHARFVITLPDGSEVTGRLDDKGERKLALPHDSEVAFPDVHVAHPAGSDAS